MTERISISGRLLVLLALILGVGGAYIAVTSLAMADDIPAARRGVGRDLEPVVIAGAIVHDMAGFSVDELFVYIYEDEQWKQIPAQVDEVTPTGVYTTTENGFLDNKDEIVFMARDLGKQAPPDVPITASLPISPGWYEIHVTDPLSPTHQGWAYLVHSKALQPTFTEDYVDFLGGFHRIVATDYTFGFGHAHPGVDHLTLGGSDVDILDRSKSRIDCAIPFICPITDRSEPAIPDHLVKDGAVRIILRGGDIIAYASTLKWTPTIAASDFIRPTSARLSLDFSPDAVGSTYYNAAVPDGVIVDGVPDSVPAQPFSPWWQLTTEDGTLVQVIDTSTISGTEYNNYYLDDSQWDEPDTGDQRHYGETGVLVSDPKTFFTYTLNFYALPDPWSNIGADFVEYAKHPLAVDVTLHGDLWSKRRYFPVILHTPLTDRDYDDFYDPPDLGQLIPSRLGEVLRYEHIRSFTREEVAMMAGLPTSSYGAESYRILYLSQEPRGTPRAVSGLLIIPTGTPPEGGYPVIVHSHLMPDLSDNCAPSKPNFSPYGLLYWAGYGYMVSATDHVGLGTPGTRPSLVGKAEAVSMLDSARAALRFRDRDRFNKPPAANKIVFEGHSIGGHSALFAHQEWQNYAPDLNILGSIALAPVSELRILAYNMSLPPSFTMGPLVLAMYSYDQYYGNPQPPQSWMKEPFASQLDYEAQSQCVAGVILWLGTNPDLVFQPSWLSAIREQRWDDLQPWSGYIDANVPGRFTSAAPVLILQGLLDTINPPEASEQLAQRLCDRGTPTQLSTYAGASHFSIPRVGRSEVLHWIENRLAGLPPPNNCATLQPSETVAPFSGASLNDTQAR